MSNPLSNEWSSGGKQGSSRPAEGSVEVVPVHEFGVTHELLDQRVAIERRRNFVALCWISSIFLFLLLAMSALLLSVGVFVLTDSRKAMASVERIGKDTGRALESYGQKVEGVASELKTVGAKTQRISDNLLAERAVHARDRRELREDLLRFSWWSDAKYNAINSALASVGAWDERLMEIERIEQARQKRFDEIEGWYRTNQTTLAEIPMVMPPSTPPAGSASPAGIEGELGGGTETIVYPDGNRYEGHMKDGMKDGYGTFAFVNGDKYFGEFMNDLRHGRGTYVYDSGARYEGEFANGKRHGRGTYFYANGDKFEGQFQDGKKNGYGVYTYADGAKVDGAWKDDKPIKRR